MNILDEYWTTEVPTEPDVYVVKTADGRVDLHIPPRGSRLASLAGARFCRLAPAAEVERLKAENEKLRGWVKEAYFEAIDDYDRAFSDESQWSCSTALARLEGRSE